MRLTNFPSLLRQLLLLFLLPAVCYGQGKKTGGRDNPFNWQEVAPGVSVGDYRLNSQTAIFPPPVVLVKISPKAIRFQVVRVPGSNPSDLQSMTRSVKGVAGINANFFDEFHQPLGLIISSGKQLHALQRGGSVLTGIFMVKDDVPAILHRDDFSPKDVQLAIQAGPRLIANGKPVQIRSDQESSRRSGVAICGDGSVIFYATMLRFPGATLQDVIGMLLDPALNVRDALNLDGGGSSQLFVERVDGKQEEIFVRGADSVPVGLIAKAK